MKEASLRVCLKWALYIPLSPLLTTTLRGRASLDPFLLMRNPRLTEDKEVRYNMHETHFSQNDSFQGDKKHVWASVCAKESVSLSITEHMPTAPAEREGGRHTPSAA